MTEQQATALANELNTALEPLMKGHYRDIHARQALGGGYLVSLTYANGVGPTQWANGIIHNDPAHTVLLIFPEKNGKMQLSRALQSYRIKQAGVPIIREKNAPQEAIFKAVVQYFTKHLPAIQAL
jgi:hypothetical protein